MDETETIKLTTYTQKCLDSDFEAVRHLDDFEVLARCIESSVLRILREVICEFSKIIFRTTVEYNAQHKLIGNTGQSYNINVQPNIFKPQNLEIAIAKSGCYSADDSSLIEKNYSIENIGKYSSVTLIYSSELDIDEECFVHILTNVINTCCTFFKFKVREFVSSDLANVSNNVYQFIFGKLCDEELSNDFWLAVVGRGVGFRLVQPTIVERLFSVFAQHRKDDDVSISELVANMLGTKLPYNQILMKEAVDHNACITVDLTNAAYTREGSLYSKTMYTLYGGQSFSIFPVYIGDVSLVALYPIEKKTAIESVLTTNKEVISTKIECEMTNIQKAFLLFKDFDDSKVVTSTLVTDSLNAIIAYLKKFEQRGSECVFFIGQNRSASIHDESMLKLLVDQHFLTYINGKYQLTWLGDALLNRDERAYNDIKIKLVILKERVCNLRQNIIRELFLLKTEAPVQYEIFQLKLKRLFLIEDMLSNLSYADLPALEAEVDGIEKIWKERNEDE